MIKTAKETVQELLSLADVKINGKRPGDMKVHNDKFYKNILSGGSLALGESYMDGWWDVDQLDEFFKKILKAELNKKIITKDLLFHAVKGKVLNLQTKKRSKEVAEKHYDLGNDFYSHMLDNKMQYTCAYFKDTKDLDKAQEQKLDLICKKLKLKKGDRILELGCGWGGFAKFAAEKYKCNVTSYNISKEQVEYARKITKTLPVKIVHDDYRHAKGIYDKVVSIGMMEHVGPKNYETFMKLVNRHLKPNGLFLLHTIGGNKTATGLDPWINKYIFPNGLLPSAKQLTTASEGIFVLEDWHNLGTHYDKTLMAWFNNFNKNWKKFEEKYGPRFYRMWKYYLLCCAGSFRACKNQLWQIVFSKEGIPEGYKSVR